MTWKKVTLLKGKLQNANLSKSAEKISTANLYYVFEETLV